MAMNVKEFLSYIKQAKSKATFKNYKQGIKKFVEWYGKSADEILKESFSACPNYRADKVLFCRFNPKRSE